VLASHNPPLAADENDHTHRATAAPNSSRATRCAVAIASSSHARTRSGGGRAPRLRPQPQRQAHEQRAQPRGPCAQPPQPSAYRRLGHPQHGRDRPMPATGRAHPKRRPDRRREVHPPSHQERRQQRVRYPAGRAATAPHPERQHPRSPAHQPPIAAPSSQPPIAARAALTGQPRAHAPAQHLLDQMSLDDYDQQRRKPRGPSRSAKNRGASFLSGAHHRARHASAPLHRPSARPRAPARKTVQNPSGFAQQRQLLRHPQPQRRRSSSTSSNNVALYKGEDGQQVTVTFRRGRSRGAAGRPRAATGRVLEAGGLRRSCDDAVQALLKRRLGSQELLLQALDRRALAVLRVGRW
jgi:hypothetical protein